jgi:hypothetical protein
MISTIAKKVGLEENNLLMKNIKTHLKSGGNMSNTLQLIDAFANAQRLGFFEPISSGNSGSSG